MLKRLCLLSILSLLFLSVMLMMADNAHADDNYIMKSYEITKVICPDGGVGYSWTTLYTWTYKHRHPWPTWECREVVEDATGFRYEICDPVHVSHGMSETEMYNVTKKRVSRYHWSCR